MKAKQQLQEMDGLGGAVSERYRGGRQHSGVVDHSIINSGFGTMDDSWKKMDYPMIWWKFGFISIVDLQNWKTLRGSVSRKIQSCRIWSKFYKDRNLMQREESTRCLLLVVPCLE
jgi:hypothetical protein